MGSFPAKRRRAAALGGVTLLFGAIALLFWYQDWRYALPTPVPPGLVQPAERGPIGLAAEVAAARIGAGTGRPVFLHFFNPDCPCSRFNLDHLRTLRRAFGDRVEFVAVLQGDEAGALARSFPRLRLGMDWTTDVDGAIARACGVYSTPQAVLLDAQGRLYFRGNYNSSRYCTAPETEFARLAAEALLAERERPQLPAEALVAYGCRLPADRRP